MSKSEVAARAEESLSKSVPRETVTWDDIGDGFELLGKVGLALAVGMSAAGLFCRLAEQGKVKIPTLSGLMLNRGEQQGKSQPSAQYHQAQV